jgi:hypothetical protein
MEAEGAVIDVEEVEVDAGGEDQPIEGEQDGAESTAKVETEDPYSSKSSREYSQWLKTLRDSGDPIAAKFARLAKDNHGAQFALRQLDPKGLDGVRERYALLDSVIHQGADGTELKGIEAVAALQDSAREIADIDQKIAAGDVTALDAFDDAMKAGIVKMTPAILSMAEKMDPEGYANAILPRFIQALAGSDLVKSFNSLVDVLNEAPPSWLTPDQKSQWTADRLQRVMGHAGGMGAWFKAQSDKAGALPKPGEVSAVKPNGAAKPTEEEAWRKEQQDQHWTQNIKTPLDVHADQQFMKLFQPYAKRLYLDQATTKALMGEFRGRVAATAAKEKPYMDQIGRYRQHRNPDPATVLNFAKVQFDKHAKTVMESLVNERYKPFLNGKPRGGQPGNTNGAGKSNQPPPRQGVQIVTVKPAEDTYDPRVRTLDKIHKKIFPLKNGKTVEWRPNA